MVKLDGDESQYETHDSSIIRADDVVRVVASIVPWPHACKFVWLRYLHVPIVIGPPLNPLHDLTDGWQTRVVMYAVKVVRLCQIVRHIF